MDLRYENLKDKPKAFRAFTGLDVEEFQILLQAFIVAWERYVQQHRLPPDVRQRDYGGGRKARLATCHDKKICDEECHEFPEGSTLYKDTGYQGYEPAGVNTRQPKKKPRGGELTQAEKEQNSLISSVRIIVEHVICGIKRCRIVKDVFRNTRDKFDDLVMEIACGLHNFRTAYRTGEIPNT